MKLLKKYLLDILVVIVFAVISFVYFMPADMDGRILFRHDSAASKGLGHEKELFQQQTGETTRWTNSVFGGMPTYQISPSYGSTQVLNQVTKAYHLCQAQNDNAEDKDDVITVTDKDGKQEEIEVPEGLEDNLDSLLHLYNTQAYMMADTSCKYRDVNPVFETQVYIDRLKRLPTLIEMPYNEVVQKFIDRYSGKLRRSVSFMLGASNFYMPIFEEALEAYNLPLELKYLPVIESALNPKAVSRVGATGLWQFMLSTGKRYGLEVNPFRQRHPC